MQRRYGAASLVLLAGLCLSLVACGQVNKLKAKKAFKEANSAYQQQDYKKAAEKYKEVVDLDPDLVTAYFYLGNSYDLQYKASRKGEAANDALLTKAVEYYKTAADRETDPKMKILAMKYLISVYGPDKLNDPAQAEPMMLKMLQVDPQDTELYGGLAKMYEDAGMYDKAEATLLKAKEVRPKDPAVFLQLAGYYNRAGEFDKTIQALRDRAVVEPKNPEAYYTIGTYYWDEARRNSQLKDTQKKEYIQNGIQAEDKALELKGDYIDALVYKNLLLRLQANYEKDPGVQQSLIRQADQLRDKAQGLQKKKTAGTQ